MKLNEKMQSSVNRSFHLNNASQYSIFYKPEIQVLVICVNGDAGVYSWI